MLAVVYVEQFVAVSPHERKAHDWSTHWWHHLHSAEGYHGRRDPLIFASLLTLPV